MEAGFKYEFGELKAGDIFAYEGLEYEKISGNTAINQVNDKPVTFGPETIVFLCEVG